MFGQPPPRYLLGLLLLAGLVQPGCVALNIPSQRLHDPSDRGGLLGHWRGSGQARPVDLDNGHCHQAIASEHGGDRSCLDGGPLCGEGCPCEDCGWADGKPNPADQVPWPRFHPVPTRPVFGS